MNAITPYLNFDGRTREAMTFYAEILGGDLRLQTFKEVGMGDDPIVADRIVHAALHSGKATLMASDTQPGQPFTQGNSIWVCVDCSSPGELDQFFAKLSAGGHTQMEPQDTFWGARFAMLTDRYGVGWMFNAELPKK